MEAVPILHDSTDAYISALALGANSASNSSNLLGKDWPGLSDAAAALIAKNYTRLEETDPLRFKAAGAALGAKVNNGTKLPLVDPLLSGVEDKLVSDFNNGGKQKLSEIADVATFGKASDTALIQELNDRFGQYNVEFTGKSIAPPSRFSNAAAVITRAITGVSLSATAINFAPCLVSISPTVASASFEFINLQPQIIATNLRFATYNAQGVNIQVRKFLISRFISRPLLLASLSLSLSLPISTLPPLPLPPPKTLSSSAQPGLILIGPQGTNVQPQGAQVSPFLIAVSPLGANVQPQGFVHAPTGKRPRFLFFSFPSVLCVSLFFFPSLSLSLSLFRLHVREREEKKKRGGEQKRNSTRKKIENRTTTTKNLSRRHQRRTRWGSQQPPRVRLCADAEDRRREHRLGPHSAEAEAPDRKR